MDWDQEPWLTMHESGKIATHLAPTPYLEIIWNLIMCKKFSSMKQFCLINLRECETQELHVLVGPS